MRQALAQNGDGVKRRLHGVYSLKRRNEALPHKTA
jgi:hypothetical protein